MTAAAWAGFLAAGAAGAVLRALAGHAARNLRPGAVPVGTAAVNVAGSLLLGVLAGLDRHRSLGSTPFLVFGAGFCGALTTFSTAALETVRLLEGGRRRAAVLATAGTLAASLAAAAVGLAVTAA